MEKLKKHKWRPVISPVVYARDYDAELRSKQCRNGMDRENGVNFQHLLSLGNSGGGNESLQSSRLMLLILMWSNANLTIILWDILSEGQTVSV